MRERVSYKTKEKKRREEMGKKLRQKVRCTPMLQNNQGGFMWGLFDILKHNHWRYIKKRLPPHKRPLPKRSSPPPPVSNSKVDHQPNVDSGQSPNKPSSALHSNSGDTTKKQHYSEDKPKKPKSRKTHSEIKRSVKALIKALVIEDKSKRKSRHHRTSTYPLHSNPKHKADPLSELDSSDTNSSNGDERNRVFNKTIGISPAIGSLNPLYLMSEESSNSDNEDFRVDNIPVDEDKSDFDSSGDSKNKDEQEAWFDPKLRHTKEVSENEDYDTSPRRSKACFDALNLIHMNRNFLLKVLQDPGSPLARHFQSQQSFSSKTMTKAGSFPTHGTNRENHNNGFELLEEKTSPSIAAEHRADGIQKLNESMLRVADHEDSTGSGYTRKRGKNQVVIKRFKDLRQKIKHVINDNKNEKQRITMDAVLDKVPRKYGFSKDLRHDILAQLKGSAASKNNKAQGSTKLKQITRASSLCGSLDRYLQLYESSFQREAKNINTPEKTSMEIEESGLPSKRVPKILGRILSSPEMKSCYALKIEDLTSQFTTLSRSIEKDEEEEEDVGLEDILEIPEDELSEHDEMPEDPSSYDRQISTLDADPEINSSGDSPTFDEIAYESHIPQDSEIQQQDPDTETVLRRKEVEIIEATAAEMDQVLEIEAQDKVKFNYVRDILEISGFNAPESLSTWQLEYQPLDPLVYEEVTTTTTTTTGCMIQDPECSMNQEEGGNCNHLLLFDLINEVLIEIYERSYHYYPKPLSSQCRIHPMPVGYSVLKEVWVRISSYLRYKPHDEQSFDKIMKRDLWREDGWMELQFESECVGIEVEDLIFDDLVQEMLSSV